MKIIRYLLSNLILITFFCAIIYVYYYWDNLTGEDTPAGEAVAYLSKEFKGVGAFIDGIKIKQGGGSDSGATTDTADEDAAVAVATASANINASTENSTVASSGADAINAGASTGANGVMNAAPADATTVASNETNATPAASHEMNAAPADSAATASATTTAAASTASNKADTSHANNRVAAYEDTGSNAIKEGVFVTPEIEKSLNQALDYPVDNQSGSSAVGIESLTKKEANRAYYINARTAFYKRDYEASISNYKKLIENSADNYDAYGEMGNVYFNQGKKTEAAAAYYEAASLLVKLGKKNQANSLIPLLNYLDTNKAEQLKELLSAGQS